MDDEMIDQAADPETFDAFVAPPPWVEGTPPPVSLPPTLLIGNYIFQLWPDLQTITT